jgi:hypothetical protein
MCLVATERQNPAFLGTEKEAEYPLHRRIKIMIRFLNNEISVHEIICQNAFIL